MAHVAFVVESGYEDSELADPWRALEAAGHACTLVGVEAGRRIEGKRGASQGVIDVAAAEAKAEDFDALVIPGGHSPDRLRTEAAVVEFVRGFFAAKKPVAAICHAGSLLVEADAVRGRRLTSWPSIRTDLRNAGATWVDRAVVEDGNLITSRKPADIPEFVAAILARLPAKKRA
jgi:protease I